MDPIPNGTLVWATSEHSWLIGIIAATNPNGTVVVLQLGHPKHYLIAKRDEVEVELDSSVPPNSLKLKSVRQLRETMGLPLNMP